MRYFESLRPAVAMVIAAAAVLFASQSYSEMQDGGYVGKEACAGCHEELAGEFAGSLHAKAGYWVSEFQGCETCHGPGAAHASSGDPTKIKNPMEMDAHEVNEFCLGCHSKGKLAHWDSGPHSARNLACTSCHSVHEGYDKFLNKADEKDVCFQCHLDVKALLSRSSHHPIREGKITCTDCHNPHGTIAPKMIDANTINLKCFECHAEKRGPFLFEHRPVTEDCTICHVPHGSNHEKLLVRKNIYLCQSCHTNSFHPGTMYAVNPATAGTTTWQRISGSRERGLYRACLNCHSNIHGSNHPSGVRFLR